MEVLGHMVEEVLVEVRLVYLLERQILEEEEEKDYKEVIN